MKVFEWIYEHVDTPYTPEEALRTTYSAIRYKQLQTGVLQILLQILLSLDLLLTLNTLSLVWTLISWAGKYLLTVLILFR